METRTITQSKVFFLALNSIHANAEQANIYAAASSEDTLRSFYNSQIMTETVVEGGMRYSFSAGLLRNCNPLHEWQHISQNPMGWQHGWFDDWVEGIGCINADIHRIDF